MEVSEIRRRLRQAMDQARQRQAERRTLVADTTSAYERILESIALPVFQTLASALAADGHRFKVETPLGVVRLVRERNSAEHLEMALDTDREVPAVVLRSTRGRGSRTIASEEIVAEGSEIADISDSNLVDAIVQQLVPLVER
jgi:hypothetical protein